MAEQMYEQALRGKEKVLGAEHRSTLHTVNNLGNLYADQGKLAEAEQMYERALRGCEKPFGVRHTALPKLFDSLKFLHNDQGTINNAKHVYRWPIWGRRCNNMHQYWTKPVSLGSLMPRLSWPRSSRCSLGGYNSTRKLSIQMMLRYISRR